MHLQTDRLILRPFEAGDLKPFSHINADPEVMRFFPAPQTSEETAQMLARWADKQTLYGYGFAAVETRQDKQLIGMAGLSRLEDGVPIAPCSELGWRLTRRLGRKAMPPRRHVLGWPMALTRLACQRYLVTLRDLIWPRKG